MARPWKILYLDPYNNVKACSGKILKTRYREMFSYERGTVEGTDIEALHSMRVSSRRLQTVLKIFQSCYPQKKYIKHYRKIKNLTRSLGAVRNYDVFIKSLEEFKNTLPLKDQPAFDLLIARQKYSRSLERKRLIQVLTVLRNEKYNTKFLQFIDDSL